MWCPAPTHTAYGRALMRALRARTAWAHAAPAFVRVCVSVRLRLRDGAGSDRDGVHIRQEGAPPASRLAPLAAAAAGPAAVRVSPHAHGTGGSLAADCGQWREHAFSVSMRTRCAASWTWAARVGQGTCACTVRVDVGCGGVSGMRRAGGKCGAAGGSGAERGAGVGDAAVHLHPLRLRQHLHPRRRPVRPVPYNHSIPRPLPAP
jgi:hypothetical protein